MNRIMRAPRAWITPGLPPKAKLKPKEHYEDILNVIYKLYHTDFLNLTEEKKGLGSADKVYVRQLFWYLMRDFFDKRAPFTWLGRIFDKDHTTVMHGVDEFQKHLDVNGIMPPSVETKSKTRRVAEDYSFTKQQILLWMDMEKLTL